MEHAQSAPPARAGDLTAQEQVVGDRQVGREREVLVHRVDTQVMRVGDRLHRDDLAPERDLTLVGGDGPRQDLGQGRLARPVVPDERDDLARSQVEPGTPERLEVTVGLGHAAHSDGRGIADRDTGGNARREHWPCLLRGTGHRPRAELRQRRSGSRHIGVVRPQLYDLLDAAHPTEPCQGRRGDDSERVAAGGSGSPLMASWPPSTTSVVPVT